MCTVAAWLFTGLEWLPWHRDPRQRPTVDTMPIDAHPCSSRLVWFAVLKEKLKADSQIKDQGDYIGTIHSQFVFVTVRRNFLSTQDGKQGNARLQHW